MTALGLVGQQLLLAGVAYAVLALGPKLIHLREPEAQQGDVKARDAAAVDRNLQARLRTGFDAHPRVGVQNLLQQSIYRLQLGRGGGEAIEPNDNYSKMGLQQPFPKEKLR